MSEPPGERIWQASSWPGFRYDRDALAAVISQARLAQGGLLGRAFTDPTVQREEHGTLAPGVVVGVLILLGESADGAVQRRTVLRAGE